MAASDRWLGPADGKSPLLFLAAGVLLAVFAAETGARTVAGGGVPAVHDVVGPAGFFVGLVGLIGLYPRLADRRPRAAPAAAVLAGIPCVGWFVLAAIGLGSVAGLAPDASLVLPGAFPIVVMLTTMLAYLVFGVVGLGGGVGARGGGLVLALPALPFLGLLLVVLILGPVAGGEVVIDTGHALAHLAVGVALLGGSGSVDRTGPAPKANP